MKAVEPLDTSLKEWSGQDNATLQNPINAYKAKITSSIPSGGGIAAIADMQNWLKTAEPLAISLGQWSNQAKATWKDQLASYIAKITSSVPSGEGIAATEKMQIFIKAIEQLNTSLDKWPSEAKSTWNDQLAAYKAKIASAIPSDRIAVIADMQNWMKAVEPLATSLDNWSSEAKATWNDELAAYKAKISSSIPSDGGIAITKKMQDWAEAAEPLATSLGKWSKETQYAWQNELASHMAKISSSISSDGGIAATADMQSWVKTVDDDLASGGKLTTQRAQERHKAEEEKRQAELKAAAEREAQELLGDQAYEAALASGKEIALGINQGLYNYNTSNSLNVFRVISTLDDGAVTVGNCENKAQVIKYVELGLQQCLKTLELQGSYNSRVVQTYLSRFQQNPDQMLMEASVQANH
jgi:hypothetical protein